MADWISVKDRLPEPGERVLATSGKFVGEAYIDQERHWHRHYGFTWMTAFGRPVTHWCKMPEPPGEEVEGMNYYAFKNSQETEVLDSEVKNSIRKNSDNCEQGKPYPQEQANVRIEDSVRASPGFQRDGGDKTERRCNQCVICGAEMPEGDQVCGYCRRKHGY